MYTYIYILCCTHYIVYTYIYIYGTDSQAKSDLNNKLHEPN